MYEIASPRHKELQKRILEIGLWEGYLTDKEQAVPGFKIDGVWYVKKTRKRILVAFEVELSKQIAKSIASLKTAYEDHGSKGVLVVPQRDIARARAMIQESFREMTGHITVLPDTEIDELFEVVSKRRIIKEKIGYTTIPF